MTRNEALERLKELPYDKDTIDDDFEFVADKLEISVDELRKLHELPLKSYKDYKNSLFIMNLGAKTLQYLGFEKQAIKR